MKRTSNVIAVLAVVLLAGVAQAASGVTWTLETTLDYLSATDRWSYTHQMRPANVHGSNGLPDDNSARVYYWDPVTRALTRSVPGTWGITENVVQAGPLPTARVGACLTWDGNVPGWWLSEPQSFFDFRRPHLILAGGVTTQGVISSEVNVFEFDAGMASGTWIATLNLIEEVAYPSCGRLTLRSQIDPSHDTIGAVVFGGYDSNFIAQTIVQGVFTNQVNSQSSWGTAYWGVSSLGARWGATIIDQHMWGPHGGENTEWYLWGGSGPSGVIQAPRHCWWDWVWASVGCETYTQTGSVPTGLKGASSSWAYNPAYANPPFSEGRPVMVVFGGINSANVPSNIIGYAEMDDVANNMIWTYFPADNPGPAARGYNTLHCGKWSWDECILPLGTYASTSTYYVGGGTAPGPYPWQPITYADVWKGLMHL